VQYSYSDTGAREQRGARFRSGSSANRRWPIGRAERRSFHAQYVGRDNLIGRARSSPPMATRPVRCAASRRALRNVSTIRRPTRHIRADAWRKMYSFPLRPEPRSGMFKSSTAPCHSPTTGEPKASPRSVGYTASLVAAARHSADESGNPVHAAAGVHLDARGIRIHCGKSGDVNCQVRRVLAPSNDLFVAGRFLRSLASRDQTGIAWFL